MTRSRLAETTTATPRSRRTKKPNDASFLPGVVGGERVLVAQVPKEESESALKKRVVVALATSGVLVFNNPVGVAKLRSGFWSHVGLGKGSSDLVCIVKTPSGVGRWLCLELKRAKGGRVAAEQERWLAMVRRWGAYSAVVRSVEEALAAANACREGVLQ